MYQHPTSAKKPNPTDIHVGSRIRMQRQLRGMSQVTLAEGLGITFQQVQKYEKGTNRVGASRLQAIADLLQVSVSFFFDDLSDTVGEPGGEVDTERRQLMEFVSSTEGIALNRAFCHVKDESLRRRIVSLVKALAGDT